MLGNPGALTLEAIRMAYSRAQSKTIASNNTVSTAILDLLEMAGQHRSGPPIHKRTDLDPAT